MKKVCLKLILSLILSVSLLAGCGAKDGGNQGGSSRLPSISLPGSEQSSSDSGTVIAPATKSSAEMELRGTQFYQGEAVEIKCVEKSNGDMLDTQDIYLCKGNGESLLIVRDAPIEYNGKWYYTEEGYCLAIWKSALVRMEPDGTETFNEIIESGVVDICQLSDGRIMMIMTEASGSMKLAELNPETGEFEKIDGVELTKDKRQYIGIGEDGLLFMNGAGVWNVNTETGELTSASTWDDYEYTLAYGVQDFRLYNGTLDILNVAKRETLLPKNVSEYRTTIAVWVGIDNVFLQQVVDDFNKQSGTYYVELHTREDAVDLDTYYGQIESALVDGIGLDIVIDGYVSDMYSKMKNGVFEDLAPYMEQSDIYKDDYFPGTFEYVDGEKIYGIATEANSTGLAISKALLGEEEEPDVETLVDALLNYSGGEVFHSSWDSVNVLNYFLCGSEDLWGMIDWGNGTCDFNGVLFAKMLEAAKIYGNGGVSGQPALAQWVNTDFYRDFYTQAVLEENGMVYVGYIFDDGCYARQNATAYLINSSSSNKEGAWAFIEYMLSEYVQSTMHYNYIPVHRAAYDTAVAREIEQTARYTEMTYDGSRVTYKVGNRGDMSNEEYVLAYSLTEYKAEQIKEHLENVNSFPTRTAAILGIIKEEAAAYFDGTAYADSVCNNIQKRVQEELNKLLDKPS